MERKRKANKEIRVPTVKLHVMFEQKSKPRLLISEPKSKPKIGYMDDVMLHKLFTTPQCMPLYYYKSKATQ